MSMTDATRPPGRARLVEAAREIAQERDLRLVVLFGSAARDEMAPGDLDLAVRGRALADTVELTNAFTRRLDFQEIDVTDLTRADPVLAVMVAREGTPIYEAGPGEFARFHSLAHRRFADTRKFRDAEHELLREFTRTHERGG